MKPLMSDQDIKLVEKELSNFSNYSDIDILEWGSGGSTEYFSEILRNRGVFFMWESIEYDVKWYIRMLKLYLTNVRFHLFDEEVLRNDDRRALRNKPMNEYVLLPRKLGKKYNVIFIDGRKRRRCLLESLDLLKLYGIVLLHDADRKYYHCVMEKYDGEFLSEKLWKGKLKKSQ